MVLFHKENRDGGRGRGGRFLGVKVTHVLFKSGIALSYNKHLHVIKSYRYHAMVLGTVDCEASFE